MQSSFVIAACVAPFILAVFFAKSKSNGAERRSLPVPAATSNQPLFCASSFVISPGNGPAPTLVMNDLYTIRLRQLLLAQRQLLKRWLMHLYLFQYIWVTAAQEKRQHEALCAFKKHLFASVQTIVNFFDLVSEVMFQFRNVFGKLCCTSYTFFNGWSYSSPSSSNPFVDGACFVLFVMFLFNY